jgi:hypothetical protein
MMNEAALGMKSTGATLWGSARGKKPPGGGRVEGEAIQLWFEWGGATARQAACNATALKGSEAGRHGTAAAQRGEVRQKVGSEDETHRVAAT